MLEREDVNVIGRVERLTPPEQEPRSKVAAPSLFPLTGSLGIHYKPFPNAITKSHPILMNDVSASQAPSRSIPPYTPHHSSLADFPLFLHLTRHQHNTSAHYQRHVVHPRRRRPSSSGTRLSSIIHLCHPPQDIDRQRQRDC